MRRIDWRTFASRSVNDSIANAGATPVACCSSARKPSSVIFCMPQSVWWMTITSRVPSRRWDTASERITSSVITPPALRRTWASPSPRRSIAKTFKRESMHVTMASRRLGRRSRCRTGRVAAKVRLLARSSSITPTRGSVRISVLQRQGRSRPSK
jgi:hypothetical protein